MSEPSDNAEAEASESSEEGSRPKVLRVPEEAVEPLERRIEKGGRRVLKRDVLERIDAVADELDRARDRAEEIVAEAREESQEIREEAREAGRREGYEELVSAISQVRERYRQIQDEAERDMVELAFRIAQQVIGREIDRDPELVREIVSTALEEVRGKRQIVVHVHPDDLEPLEDQREALSEQLEGAALYFEAHSGIRRGGCLIETESNRVDATLEMQLERLREAIVAGSE